MVKVSPHPEVPALCVVVTVQHPSMGKQLQCSMSTAAWHILTLTMLSPDL